MSKRCTLPKCLVYVILPVFQLVFFHSDVLTSFAHSKKELGPGTGMAVKTWAKRLGRQTVSITMASGGESSKTFGSSAINTVSLTENDIPGARLPREVPEECNVTQLKRWLSCRGACTTGKKQQLITRLVSFQQDFEICFQKLMIYNSIL